MSRIGNQPVVLPKGVTFAVADGAMRVQGPKGSLQRKIVAGVNFAEEGGAVVVRREGDSPQHRAYHGLMRALLNNMVTGVSKGFERRLEIVGVGYKAELRGSSVVLNLGYSHPIEYAFPPGIHVQVEKNTKLVVSGIDKEQVGQVASELRAYRPPDSYKGKGVRYEGERVRLKAGKSGQK